jgi:hypothetical protein
MQRRKSSVAKRKRNRNNNNNNNNKKCKKHVMFDLRQSTIVAHIGSTIWLSSKEYESIRREVELTIVLREKPPDALFPRLYSRGLEDFLYAETNSTGRMATCLKPEVLLRRRLMIRAVLDEQESQRRQQQQQQQRKRQRGDGDGDVNKGETISKGKYQQHHQQQQQQHQQQHQQHQQQLPYCHYDDTALRNACLLRSNRENVMRGIERGLKDSEQARAVCKEDLLGIRLPRGNVNTTRNVRTYW